MVVLANSSSTIDDIGQHLLEPQYALRKVKSRTVRAIVSLAHSLRLQVIAEGVETSEQLEFLRELGCDQYQGYYCSAPMPVDVFNEMMQRQLKVMDSTAFSLCMDNRMPIIVFDLFKPHNLKRVVLGEQVGTLVTG